MTHAPPSPAPSVPPPPDNPTLRDIYALIDARISPTIVERLSSIPPPESRPSRAVQAGKTAGRWTKWAMAAIGLLAVIGESVAEVQRWRGPISQALVVIGKALDSAEAEQFDAAPPSGP